MLEVGVLHAPPWVDTSAGEPEGLEVRLLEDFAASLGLEVEWRLGGMEELFEALERRELDFIAGGLTDANPWKSRVGFTQPWFVTFRPRPLLDKHYRHVFAAPRRQHGRSQRRPPYGASTLAGNDGSRQPSANELDIARFQVQGEHVAKLAKKLSA